MSKKKHPPPRKRKPAPEAIATAPTMEQIKEKLAALDALKKKVKEAAGTAPVKEAKPPKKPRFSGSWGCGK